MADLSVHDRAVLSCIFNPSLPLDAVVGDDVNLQVRDEEDDTDESRRVNEMELNAVQLAEAGSLEASLKMFEEAIGFAPARASLYNNRAQVYQLKRQFDDAFADLTKAIELVKDKQLRTKREAYCQRGLLYRKMNKDDLAREDFNEAAKLGSQFAKSQLIEMNPYAALCNQMLKQAFENLQ